ncbi:SsrA-binding protein SmpB [Candidatus Fermentibacterales bacterium]|nr:SsrA-binding protein SmpB [Candidatus Fermentibacterales bacterium]
MAELKILARNRKARHDYFVLETMEVGLVLVGSEIKSIRNGKVSLQGSYASFDADGQLWLKDMHVAEYPQARDNHDPSRRRKLLAHASELRKLRRKTMEQGLTLVPLDVHLRDGRAKIELGLCRGKRLYDKRADIAERDAKRRIEAAHKSVGRSE